MNWIDLLLSFGVAIICGTLAQLTSRFARGGWFIHLGVGFAGALAGVSISRELPVPVVYNLQFNEVTFPIAWAVIGSVIFVASLGFFVKTGRH